jgi:hypothetical protein
MNRRVSIALRCGGMKEPGLISMGHVERVPGAVGADLKRLNPQPAIVFRACWRCEIENKVDFSEIEWSADIVLMKFEAWFRLQMLQVLKRASAEIIYSRNGVPVSQKCIREMRT